MTIFLILLIAISILCIFMLIRNDLVYGFRNKLIDEVYSRPDWFLQRKIFHSVSYTEMLYKFWKKLTIESFYKGKDFLK